MPRMIACAPTTACVVAVIAASLIPAGARDDGRYANSPLKAWFDQLASGKGLCCSFADGVKIEDVDWGTTRVCAGSSETGQLECRRAYYVTLHGRTVVVPDDAVVTESNRFGPAVVWPYLDSDGVTQIRCFLPGAGG